jgi:hypothetical protein
MVKRSGWMGRCVWRRGSFPAYGNGQPRRGFSISKHVRSTARMYPDHDIASGKRAQACPSDQSGHVLARIDRIERKGLGPRSQTDRFLRCITGDTKGSCAPLSRDFHTSVLPAARNAEQCCRSSADTPKISPHTLLLRVNVGTNDRAGCLSANNRRASRFVSLCLRWHGQFGQRLGYPGQSPRH